MGDHRTPRPYPVVRLDVMLDRVLVNGRPVDAADGAAHVDLRSIGVQAVARDVATQLDRPVRVIARDELGESWLAVHPDGRAWPLEGALPAHRSEPRPAETPLPGPEQPGFQSTLTAATPIAPQSAQDPSAGAERWTTQHPQEAVPAPEATPQGPPPFVVAAPRPPGDPLPRVTGPAPTTTPQPFTWVGAHGGAGASSLAATGTGADLTAAWPDPAFGWPSAVAVVCRSNMAGLDAAARLLQEAAAGLVPDLHVVALVVVDDQPARHSKKIRTRIRELGGTVPHVFRVPWINSWREEPYKPARSTAKVAVRIEALVEKENQK